ncbi:kinesin motor domain-containing protein [Ditylenchus destructor]|nr:kinesin motor domain-containing protein [Ditylenchus destructor]
MDRLSIGMVINVQRSDGRVHQAIIDEIKDNDSVGVSWHENGKDQGKTLSLTAIRRSNAELFKASRASMLPSTDDRPTSENVPRQSLQNLDKTITDFDMDMDEHISSRRTVCMSVDLDESANMDKEDREDCAKEEVKVVRLQRRNTMQSKGDTRQRATLKPPQMPKKPGINPQNAEILSMIRDYQSELDYSPLKVSDEVKEIRICVAVRKRPLNSSESKKGEIEIVSVHGKDELIVHQPQAKVDLTKYVENQQFRFDYTFDEKADIALVHKFTAQPLIETIFEGGRSTCFAYGQTGSGKTHTMGGTFVGKRQVCSEGIYALAAQDVFDMLQSPKYNAQNLSVYCTFFEIYGSNAYDLLNKKIKLRILEDGKKQVQVVDLTETRVHNVAEVMNCIKSGSERRTAGTTTANSNSSRSHAVFQIILRKVAKAKNPLHGKISLIDLAGNERGKDANSGDQQTRMEGAEINRSLLALKECIRAMGRDQDHVPFRDSKLTLVLRDSFTEKNSKVCMIATISPAMSHVEDTLNTLRYADRVKELGNDSPKNATGPSNKKYGTRK